MDYPIWDVFMGGGVLIGFIAIAHVLVSHFAVGGGIAIAVVETLAVRRRDAALRGLAKRGSLMLILISTVFGAISGVGIWVTIGLVQPAATSTLIHTFVWGWASEWVFFILEVATALAYYATWEKVRPRTHLLLIWLYAFAAYMSLVIIQPIISFMLTPGRWLETRAFWDGIFNPSNVPGLVFRTGVCLLLAGAYLMFAALREPDRTARARLVRLTAAFEVAGSLIAYGGFRWWESALSEPIRGLFLGRGARIAGLATTRHMLLWALALALVMALFAWVLPRLQRWPVAIIGLAATFVFFGGYERLREGSRKPFVIHGYMFSNGVLVEEIGLLNENGILAKARWAVVENGEDPNPVGRAVFRAECASCHTVDGYLSIRNLVSGGEKDMMVAILSMMREDGEVWASGGEYGSLAYPFMPPFVGTDEEMDALAGYLERLGATGQEEVADAR